MKLTREKIETMKAGSEIEILISDHVFKLSTLEWNRRFFNNRTKFSTDISAAWEVVKEMSAQNYWFGCQVLSSRCQAWFEKDLFKHDSVASTYDLPLAICRAALIAVMDNENA